MKVLKTSYHTCDTPQTVVDMFVDKGYLQGPGGALPDVDVDYQSDRRQDIKSYIERRYNHDGKQRVFSAGTVTTLKIKAVIKDVARTHRIPVNIVNYITSMIEDDACDYTGFFMLAAQNKKIAKFIHTYPDLFEEIRTLMFQPRSNSIHASALLVTPDEKDGEDMECFDYVPIKKVDGILVSENDGYELDELGLLKNDCLATKELSKLHATMDLCNKVYNAGLTLEGIVMSTLDDSKVYKLLSAGYTQNVFQFSSKGMTKFLMDMQPTCINDLIAANALYRPATLENGSTESYVNCKNGIIEPHYLWGTYEALKNTYGLITYQEQVVLIARNVGGFSLGDGVKLVKFISKKKTEKIQAMKEKFMTGAAKNQCPSEDAKAIWEQIEACGSYLFNKSHATAYAVTSYVGAYLKANYPTAFYTIALQWADDKELVSIMNEMELCSTAKVVSPDINVSRDTFYADFETDSIFWSLGGIKFVGARTVDWIIKEREHNGPYLGVEDLINRIHNFKDKSYKSWEDDDTEEEFKQCPVNAKHIRNFILAGCFDQVENIKSKVERYALIKKAAELLGFQISEKEFPADMIDKHYFWAQEQIKVSSIGSVDYKRIFDNSHLKAMAKGKASYTTLKKIAEPESDEKRVAVCATVVEIEEKKFTSKKDGDTKVFCKLLLQQDNELCECVIWPEEYANVRGEIKKSKDRIIVFFGVVKYSDFIKKNHIQFTKRSMIEVL